MTGPSFSWSDPAAPRLPECIGLVTPALLPCRDDDDARYAPPPRRDLPSSTSPSTPRSEPDAVETPSPVPFFLLAFARFLFSLSTLSVVFFVKSAHRNGGGRRFLLC